jgi:hypothetical protein
MGLGMGPPGEGNGGGRGVRIFCAPLRPAESLAWPGSSRRSRVSLRVVLGWLPAACVVSPPISPATQGSLVPASCVLLPGVLGPMDPGSAVRVAGLRGGHP